VLVEQPSTLSLESAERGVQAARARAVVLAVAHNRRFLPAIARLRELLAGEVLGTVLHVEANPCGPDGFDYPADGWRADPAESPAGGMTAMGIHMVDTMIGLLGRVASVRAQSFRRVLPIARDDTTSVLLRFANDASGCLGTTEATAANSRLQIFGSTGWAELREERHLRLSIIGRAPEDAVFPAVDITLAELEAFADGRLDASEPLDRHGR
jgi:predicted dehydrogenase